MADKTDTDGATTAPVAAPTPLVRRIAKPVRRAGGGVLHTAHDVTRLEGECNRLVEAISRHGASLDLDALQRQGSVLAAVRILEAKGIATDDEIQGERLTVIKTILAEVLQQVEERALQAAREAAGLQVVERPKLAIATH